MRLRYTILYVDSVRDTVAFYERAFGLIGGFVHEGGDYGEIDTGETKLSFSSRGLMRSLGKSTGRPDASAPIFEIAFETADVAPALERARQAGAEVLQEPREEPWGQTTAYVRDLNGFLVEICTPVSQP